MAKVIGDHGEHCVKHIIHLEEGRNITQVVSDPWISAEIVIVGKQKGNGRWTGCWLVGRSFGSVL